MPSPVRKGTVGSRRPQVPLARLRFLQPIRRVDRHEIGDRDVEPADQIGRLAGHGRVPWTQAVSGRGNEHGCDDAVRVEHCKARCQLAPHRMANDHDGPGDVALQVTPELAHHGLVIVGPVRLVAQAESRASCRRSLPEPSEAGSSRPRAIQPGAVVAVPDGPGGRSKGGAAGQPASGPSPSAFLQGSGQVRIVTVPGPRLPSSLVRISRVSSSQAMPSP